MEKAKAGRFLKNTVNNRILAWTKALSEKDTMIECDKNGNPKLDNVPVEDGKLVISLQNKAKECNDLRKELAVVKTKLNKYISLHGELKDQLPEKPVEQLIKEAESDDDVTPEITVDKEVVTNDVVTDYRTQTNRELTNEIKERGLTMPDKINKDSLVTVLEEADEIAGV